jgi:murein DD-endopeptidase MepM/ murein hydrolase activator NlpD
MRGPMARLLVLCAAVFSPHALVAQATSTSKPATVKASGKSSTKKHVAKHVARIVRKPVRKPLPPPADIPAVLESASVWRGCLESQDLPKLASSFGMEQPRLAALLEEKGLVGSQGDCIAYVAATGGEAGAASAIFRHTEATGESRTIAFHKTGDTVIVTPGGCDCQESTHRVLSLPAREFPAPFTESINSVSASIASNVRWQLAILVPHMIGRLRAKGISEKESATLGSNGDAEAKTLAGESEPHQAESLIDGYMVRVVVGRHGDDERERLESVEIVDPVSGKRLDGAWWLDRPDGPGVIIGMDGVAYERLLWESPVKYVRSSRGVGASVTTFRRRVPAKKGSAKSTVVRTIQVPGYHLGVDMTAPKGTEVHAVGDANVSFVGRRSGFGNLIILDHGRGYQTYYAHLSKVQKGIKAGVRIARGDVIGLVGSTGRSTAPHLHFETRKDSRYLDPFDETRQLGFWLLTADEQERLAMQLFSAASVVADEDLAARQQ